MVSKACICHISYLLVLVSTDDDNPDIIRQMGLLYARTNMLIRKFGK